MSKDEALDQAVEKIKNDVTADQPKEDSEQVTKLQDENKKLKDQIIELQNEINESKTKRPERKASIYETLSNIDVRPYLKKITGKKYSLYYLSWANALALVKPYYPDLTYEITEYPIWVKTANGNYQQIGTQDYRVTSIGYEVEVTAIIEGRRFTQKLYPMDRYNNPIPKPTYADINKTQLRCFVKALATAGLGIDVYAGEDLPVSSDEIAVKRTKRANQQQSSPQQQTQANTLGQYLVHFEQDGKSFQTTLEHLYNSTKDKDKTKAENAEKVAQNLQGQDRANWLVYSSKRDAA